MMSIPKTETPDSSYIHWFSYQNGVLTVQFKRKTREGYEPGGTYSGEIPEELAQKMLATHVEGGSVGSFYHRHIRSLLREKAEVNDCGGNKE